jgi:hypothetical protein
MRRYISSGAEVRFIKSIALREMSQKLIWLLYGSVWLEGKKVRGKKIRQINEWIWTNNVSLSSFIGLHNFISFHFPSFKPNELVEFSDWLVNHPLNIITWLLISEGKITCMFRVATYINCRFSISHRSIILLGLGSI